MTQEPHQGGATVTLGEAAREYISSLKPAQQQAQESSIRRCLEYFGDQTTVASLSGSKVESFATSQIKSSDRNAEERVGALKGWFQFMRKRGYADQNYGVHIRVRRPAGSARSSSSASKVEEAPVEMTQEGFDGRMRQLTELQGRRPDILRAIATAREDKDFRENAPLQAAREELGMVDGEIKQLENEIKRAVIVEHTGSKDLSGLGSLVTVTRLDTGKKESFTLVGSREANAREKKISVESPVGRELLNRRVGDEVEVAVPSGTIQYRVEGVVHP